MIRIEEVSNKKHRKAFIDFPHSLYKDDINYVPELFIAQKDLLTPGRHPFYEHSDIQLFLAYENMQLKGRIAAILNNNHNSFNNTSDGFFGFFDCVNNIETAAQLFNAAAKWLMAKGATTMIGPVNPSTNEPCGLMIDGFDQPPVVMTVYNKSYYGKLIEDCGFAGKVDLLAYDIKTNNLNGRSLRLQDALMKRLSQKNITIRPVNLKDFSEEVLKVKQVYNAAWDKNPGFVPMTDNEFKYLAKDLKLILNPNLCLVAEHNGKLVGFALAIPDINQVLIKIKKGRLLPAGIFKLLFGLKKINRVRVLALGVTDGYRKLGIEVCFYASFMKHALERNMSGAEASWVLEHNDMMNRGIESINGKVYKKYRIYEKTL